MGMFDDIVVKVPLPGLPEGSTPGFQTKSLDNGLVAFEIREDGSLWREAHDYEDRSDPNATGFEAVRGMLTRVNSRWVPETDFTGEVRFYDDINGEWFEYSAYFHNGQMRELHRVNTRR